MDSGYLWIFMDVITFGYVYTIVIYILEETSTNQLWRRVTLGTIQVLFGLTPGRICLKPAQKHIKVPADLWESQFWDKFAIVATCPFCLEIPVANLQYLRWTLNSLCRREFTKEVSFCPPIHRGIATHWRNQLVGAGPQLTFAIEAMTQSNWRGFSHEYHGDWNSYGQWENDDEFNKTMDIHHCL